IDSANLVPDPLREIENRGRLGRREIEVLVAGRRVFHCGDDPAGEIAAVRVMPDLRAVAENTQWVLPLDHLLDGFRDPGAHCELDVAARALGVGQGTLFADTDTVEWPDDRVRKPVLVPLSPGEIFGRQLLESVGRQRRRDAELVALDGRPPV